MSDVVDLSFVDRIPQILERRDQFEEGLRENCRTKTSRAHDFMELAIEYARRLVAHGFEAEDELKEMEAFANSLLLVTALIRKQAQ